MTQPFKEKTFRVHLVSLFVAMYLGKRGRSYRDRVVETACELDAAGELTIGDLFNAAFGGTRLYVRELIGAVLLGGVAFALFASQVAGTPGVVTTRNQFTSQHNYISTPVAYWTTAGYPGGCHATSGPSKVFFTLVGDTSHHSKTYHMLGSCSPSLDARL